MFERGGVVLCRLLESEIRSQSERVSLCSGCEDEEELVCRRCESERELVFRMVENVEELLCVCVCLRRLRGSLFYVGV